MPTTIGGPQIIRTASGEELVVLPRAEYEALVSAAADTEEDAADAAIFDERMAELKAGKAELLPGPVSAALVRGESLLRALRKWRGLQQGELAARAGIGQGYLSDLEAGRRAGSPETLTALAGALDVPKDWLAIG